MASNQQEGDQNMDEFEKRGLASEEAEKDALRTGGVNSSTDKPDGKSHSKDQQKQTAEKSLKNAKTLKHLGNKFLKESMYEDAMEMYTTAIDICPEDSTKLLSFLHSKRAACKFRLKMTESAIEDLGKAYRLYDCNKKALSMIIELDEKTKETSHAARILFEQVEEKMKEKESVTNERREIPEWPKRMYVLTPANCTSPRAWSILAKYTTEYEVVDEPYSIDQAFLKELLEEEGDHQNL